MPPTVIPHRCFATTQQFDFVLDESKMILHRLGIYPIRCCRCGMVKPDERAEFTKGIVVS